MEDFWARLIDSTGQAGLNYWEYFAERLAQLATIPGDGTILDLGTYDGNVLFKAMPKMMGGFGVGADISADGFQDGVNQIRDGGWGERVAFVQADANLLAFPSDRIHTVLANFVGWDDCYDFRRMEFIHPDKMSSEIMRVLKPGGQVGIGSWVEQNDIDWIIQAFKKYLPEYQDTKGKEIICYGRENTEGQRAILQKAGFEKIQTEVEKIYFISPDKETWWRQMKQAAYGYFKKVSDPIELESFKERVFVDLRPYEYHEGIRFHKTVSFAFGVKPG